jgi:hypothetical protein
MFLNHDIYKLCYLINLFFNFVISLMFFFKKNILKTKNSCLVKDGKKKCIVHVFAYRSQHDKNLHGFIFKVRLIPKDREEKRKEKLS